MGPAARPGGPTEQKAYDGHRHSHRSGSLRRSAVADYVTLTKPRIMLLILITAYGAMAYAADGLPDLRLTWSTLIGLGLSSGGAAALNHYFDRDLDALMTRTATRPIPAGRVSPESALGFGIGLIAGLVLPCSSDERERAHRLRSRWPARCST